MYPEVALRAAIALASDPESSLDDVIEFLSGVRQELNALGLERLGIAHCAAVPQVNTGSR